MIFCICYSDTSTYSMSHYTFKTLMGMDFITLTKLRLSKLCVILLHCFSFANAVWVKSLYGGSLSILCMIHNVMYWLCSYHGDTVMRTIPCEETEAISCVPWATVAGRPLLNGDDNWETSVRDKPVHMLSIRYCLEPRGVRVKVHSTIPIVHSFNPLSLHGN